MHLPAPIRTYFTVKTPHDGEAFGAAFTAEAIVHDEGKVHHGPEEIRAWWQAAKDKYRHSAEPLELTEVAGKTAVRALVSGNFPGSPAILTFTFGLAGGRITDLKIS